MSLNAPERPTRTHPFTDYTTGNMGARCVLVVPDEGRCYPSDGEPKIGVQHPDRREPRRGDEWTKCDTLADLAVELDCFYCPKCGWNGRVSGVWAVQMIERGK